jgi:predicted nucleic acid-binding protein
VLILDTNVLSALMRATPDPAVVRWLDGQAPESLWTTSITVFEVRLGLALLPLGRRQDSLIRAFEALLSDDLEDRVLDFDSAAAAQAASLAAQRQRSGRPVDMRDTQIAGIALARRAGIVTRNVRHFNDIAVGIVDPWASPR